MTARGPLGYSDTGIGGGGPTLVLIHGIQGTSASWNPVVPGLARAARVVVPDLRGRGASPLRSTSLEDATLPAFADDVHVLLQALRADAFLVGWSLGVFVTLQLVDVYGVDGIRGVVLVSGSSFLGEEARWFQSGDPEGVAREAEARRRRMQLSDVAPPDVVAASWASVRAADLRPALSRVVVPALVMHGACDEECPLAHAHAMTAALPKARLSTWQDCGHNLMTIDPRRFEAEVLSFIGDASDPTS